MKRIAAAAILVACLAAPARATDPWDRTEKILGASWLALQATDWIQTRAIERHPGMYETNPILGRHPTHREIDGYFAASTAAMFIAADLMPAGRWRKGLLGVGILVTGKFVICNFRIGLP